MRAMNSDPTDRFNRGLLIGLLIGRASFGGDGKQPQVVIKMDAGRKRLLSWLVSQVPGSRVFGPYEHRGKKYIQWMVRGKALRGILIPAIKEADIGKYDLRMYRRFRKMIRENFLKCL